MVTAPEPGPVTRVVVSESTTCASCFRPITKGAIAATDGIKFWHPKVCTEES